MAPSTPQLGQWTTGLFGCFEDIESCCCSWCCTCVPVGQLANTLDNGETSCLEAGLIFCVLESLTGLCCLYTCGYRKKLRTRFSLPADPCSDVCTDAFCLCCSVAQAHRELKNRNIDPSLGYAAGPPSNPPTVVGYAAAPPSVPPATQFMHKG